jgi:peptide/histidine transporter 3/4
MSAGAAAASVNAWSGTCYLTAIFGAVIADSYLGRFKTIVGFASLYCVGMVCLALTTLDGRD